jgi:3-dehydroquinate synthase
MNGKLTVRIKEILKSYDIFVGDGIFKDYRFQNDDVFIVDGNVYQGYRSILPHNRLFIFYADELKKSWESVLRIIDFLIEKNCNRKTRICAIGGGITGDVAAFAASIYMRGVPLIQIPTTLLSMVDSSVGGKTGINFKNIKNLVGSFNQPESVIVDISFLKSLDENEFLNGLAEVIKMAFLFDEDLLKKIISSKEDVLNRSSRCLIEMIIKSIELKIRVVEIDEKEENERKLLNFGHTIGHAIEFDTNFTIKHGYAVAMGMFYECLYGVKHKIISKEVLTILQNLLEQYKLFSRYKIKNLERFRFALTKDKKIEKDSVVFSLPINLGESRIFNNIDIDEIIKVINDN